MKRGGGCEMKKWISVSFIVLAMGMAFVFAACDELSETKQHLYGDWTVTKSATCSETAWKRADARNAEQFRHVPLFGTIRCVY